MSDTKVIKAQAWINIITDKESKKEIRITTAIAL